jgi:hypothetical protein
LPAPLSSGPRPDESNGRAGQVPADSMETDRREKAIEEFMREIIERGYVSLLGEIRQGGSMWMRPVLDQARTTLLDAVSPHEAAREETPGRLSTTHPGRRTP